MMIDMTEDEKIRSATEELRKCLNHTIREYKLDGPEVLNVITRISAAFIHMLQHRFDDMGADIVVEEQFQQLLKIYLTSLDVSNVGPVMDKALNEEAN